MLRLELKRKYNPLPCNQESWGHWRFHTDRNKGSHTLRSHTRRNPRGVCLVSKLLLHGKTCEKCFLRWFAVTNIEELSRLVDVVTQPFAKRMRLYFCCFQGMLIMGQGTDDYILVMFWITIWLQDLFEGFLPRVHPRMSCLAEVCALWVLF